MIPLFQLIPLLISAFGILVLTIMLVKRQFNARFFITLAFTILFLMITVLIWIQFIQVWLIPQEELIRKEKLELFGCNATYGVYTEESLERCNKATGGHCGSNEMSMLNAEVDIVDCLCDKYLENPTPEIEREILHYCEEINRGSGNCGTYDAKTGTHINLTQNVSALCSTKDTTLFHHSIE